MVIDLHSKKQVNICKRLEKKVQKTVWSLKFTKSKARNFAENQWSTTKLKVVLWVMVIDLQAKRSGQYLQAFRKKIRKTDSADWQTDGRMDRVQT